MTATIIEQPTQSESVALRAKEGEGAPAYLPLGVLRLDDRNVRKDAPSDVEIQQLADLIDSQGLLQNLHVIAYPSPVKGKGKEKGRAYTHGVIAGGRRLRALQALVKRGRLTLDEPILCTVVSDDRALAVSAAENSGRAPMSTADTIVAFADMVRAGAGVEDLAVCFSLSPLTVQRRLRLANVSPDLFVLFRQGGMSLDQLMALALTDDHAAQEAAWAAAPAYDRSPRALRALIAGEGLSQAITRFVGLDSYEAAGGAVLRDLFSDLDEQPAYIQDPALMMRLATEKLEGLAQIEREAGAAWVEVFTSWSYTESQQFVAPPSARRAPTDSEATRMEELEAQADALAKQLEAAYESEEDDDGGLIERLEAEAEAVADYIAAIEDGQSVVAPEVAALVGTVIYIDHQGQSKAQRNLIRKADADSAKRAAAKVAGRSGSGEAAGPGAGLSDRLCHQLTAHRTRALQASMLADSRVALAALLHPLLNVHVYGLGASWKSPSAIKVSTDSCESQLNTWAPDLADSRAEKAVQEALQVAQAIVPEEAAALLPWLLQQPLETLVQLLTLVSALSLNAINGTGKNETTAAIASAVHLDMADWWTPTDASYLGSVSKALISEAVADAGMPGEAEALQKLKKGEAVAKAEALLSGKRWLPAVLR
ncbi:ParB/RepB/Spo0J family partition protein [Paracidovorax citrulli]|nr:ParB/Srx family N-terminal domain-containing protein [Paracidovorax citrulli]QCX13171.1 Chromossome partitioning protein ParB [Paracidovorax citrulli]